MKELLEDVIHNHYGKNYYEMSLEEKQKVFVDLTEALYWITYWERTK